MAVAAMFHITFEVEKLEAGLGLLNRQIAEEQESIHVLQAEWSYLNRPQRLEELSRELLPNLAPVRADQFVSIGGLPIRPAAVNEKAAIRTPTGFVPAIALRPGGHSR